MLEGCGTPVGASSGCDDMVGVGGVARVGGGWASWHFLRVFIISSWKSLRIFWTISSGLNGSGFVVFTSGGAFGCCRGSDGVGTCGLGDDDEGCGNCWSWWMWDVAWVASCWLSRAFCCCKDEIWAWDCACCCIWGSPPLKCPPVPGTGRTVFAAGAHIGGIIGSGLDVDGLIHDRKFHGNGNMGKSWDQVES